MHAYEAIQKTIDYIEDHLTEEIQIDQLSEIAGLSMFYYQRLFTRLVNVPVGEYIKQRRLARVTTDIQLNQFVKPELCLNYVIVDENVPLITDGMVIEITRKKLTSPRNFIGIEREIPISELMGGADTCVSSAEELWNEFHRVKSGIPQLIAGGNEFGALYMGNAKPGYCMYMAGAEAEYGAVSKGYDNFELPAAQYLVCGFEAQTFDELTNSSIFKAQTFMGRWMEKHKLTTTDFAVEMYYPVTAEHAYMEHWMLPVPMESES